MATTVLTNQQFTQLNTALNEGFSVDDLDLMMSLQLGKDLSEILCLLRPKKYVVLEITKAARR